MGKRGRILKKLVLSNTLKSVPFYCSRTHKKRNRMFTKHARHWKYGMKENNIPLFVLPQRKPRYNGTVERSNWTTKYEFLYQYQDPSKMDALRTKISSSPA